MTSAQLSALRSLVAGQAGHPAERAGAAMSRLADHLSRLLGATGVATIIDRSIVLASARYAWLATPRSSTKVLEGVLTAFQALLADQPPDAALAGFVGVVVSLVELLERLIGAGLVDRLLEEVWPGAFGTAVKDPP